ncbi:MAG: 2Fe-2S iron-sulfur cluster-binding protein [Gammaproteobacteria bacterium]
MHSVTIEGSGHQFICEDGESVLEAALRSGITLRYGCNNGSCGDCEARLISGNTIPTRHSDFVPSKAARAAGCFLTCANTASSDLVIAANEPGSADELPEQSIVARPSRMEHLEHGITRLLLRTPRTQTLRFLAGQWVTLRCEDGLSTGAHVASCPCNGMQLEFFIQASAHKTFHERLSALGKKPAQLTVEGPHGEYLFDDDGHGPLLFIAHMEGFAACKSLIEHAFALDWPDPIEFIWITEADAPQRMINLLRAWHDALEGFDYEIVPPQAIAPTLGMSLRRLEDATETHAEGPVTVFVAADINAADIISESARIIPLPFPPADRQA